MPPRMVECSLHSNELAPKSTSDISVSSEEEASLTWDNIELGGLLGQGAFSAVYLVSSTKNIQIRKIERFSSALSAARHLELSRSDGTVSSSETPPRAHRSREPVALKCIKDGLDPGSNDLRQAIDCLRKESKLLTELPSHPNVIHLVAVSDDLQDDPSGGFILLQYVPVTLEGLLKRWKMRSASSSFHEHEEVTGCLPLFTPSARRRKNGLVRHEQASRIGQVALGVARAMTFLHQNRILYRDLKPANVGLDLEGQVRLFDFGFARQHDETGSGNRLLTRKVGSMRYMAPEVASDDKEYGFPADVYSFAILLWQILTLRTPFDHFKTRDCLIRSVHCKKQRPSVRPVRSSALKKLLKASWHPSPHMRPTFALIEHQLAAEASLQSCVPC